MVATVIPRGASRPVPTSHTPRRPGSLSLAASVAVLVAVIAACAQAIGAPAPTAGSRPVLRLGYFPNVTHATAIVGVERGIFAADLAGVATLEPHTFNAGPAAIEAIFSGGLDATYVGPNPAINAYAQSKGAAIRIISGATSGGASLVVRATIATAADLKGKHLGTPQLGGTQDVALRSWLAKQGLSAPAEGGGDVTILPRDNAQTLDAFKSGQIDGAWVPEPWATRLVQEASGRVLVDERSLWPEGRFVTTQLIVRTAFLRDHPDIVRALLKGQVEADAFVNTRAAEAQGIVNAGIERITGKKLKDAVIAGAWKTLTFTNDPIASSLRTSADNAQSIGLLKPVDLSGIYDLAPLNAVLAAAGLAAVPAP